MFDPMLHWWVEENSKHLTDGSDVCDCENDLKLLSFSWSPTSRSRVWTQRVSSGSLEPPPESRSDRRAAGDARVCYFCGRFVIVTDLPVCVSQAVCHELEHKFYEGMFPWESLKQHDAASLLKLFIRELPYPLLTVEYFNAFTSVLSESHTRTRLGHGSDTA